MFHIEPVYDQSYAATKARRSVYLCSFDHFCFVVDNLPSFVEYEYHDFEDGGWRQTGVETFTSNPARRRRKRP